MKINSSLIEELISQDYANLEQFAEVSGISERVMNKAITQGLMPDREAQKLADFWNCEVDCLQPYKSKYSKNEMYCAIFGALDKYNSDLESPVEIGYALYAKQQIAILEQVLEKFKP